MININDVVVTSRQRARLVEICLIDSIRAGENRGEQVRDAKYADFCGKFLKLPRPSPRRISGVSSYSYEIAAITLLNPAD